jgi:hypothetical protein
MAPKLRLIPGGLDSSTGNAKIDTEIQEGGDSLLSKVEIGSIKEWREIIANIPTTSEDECLNALKRFEGPNHVESTIEGGSILTMDRRGLFSDLEKTKNGFVPIRDYLKRLFENRIENVIKRPQALWDKIYP